MLPGRRVLTLVAILLITSMLLSGCGATPTPTAAPTKAPVPTTAPVPPTAAPTARPDRRANCRSDQSAGAFPPRRRPQSR